MRLSQVGLIGLSITCHNLVRQTLKKLLNRYHTLVALSIIFAVLLVSEPVFAQKTLPNPNITATTDKPSYIFGDTIVISGAVKTVVQGSAITISILDPYSNLIQTSEATVAQDGSYTDDIEITGSAWKLSGVYTVLVQYGSEAQTQMTFAYTATTAPINNTFQVQSPIQSTSLQCAIYHQRRRSSQHVC